MYPKYIIPALLGVCAPTFANDQSGASSTGGGIQVLMILIIVLGLMVAAAWLLKKFNATGATSGGAIKIIGGVAIGSRERIMVVEVADQWIVIGVTASNISALATMPKQEATLLPEDQTPSNSFSSRLKQFIEKRNAK
jgi:flagellar protein FliO/FliZ